MVSRIEIYSKLYNEEDKKMRYFDIKKDSLEEVISKAINEKPEQLKEEVIKEAFSKDIQDFISTGGIMSKVIKQARDVTPKELKDKKFLQKILNPQIKMHLIWDSQK